MDTLERRRLKSEPPPLNYAVSRASGFRRIHITIIFSHDGTMIVHGENVNDEYKNAMHSMHSERHAFDKLFTLLRMRDDLRSKVKRGVYVVNWAFNATRIAKISEPCEKCAKYIAKVNSVAFPVKRMFWTTTQFEVSPQHVWAVSSIENIKENRVVSSGERFKRKKRETEIAVEEK